MKNGEFLLDVIGEVEENLIPILEENQGKSDAHMDNYTRSRDAAGKRVEEKKFRAHLGENRKKFMAWIGMVGMCAACLMLGFWVYDPKAALEKVRHAGEETNANALATQLDGTQENDRVFSGDSAIIWGDDGEGHIIEQGLPERAPLERERLPHQKEGRDMMMDEVLRTEMTQFMQYFMERPVLDTFTQEDPYKILYFSVYKMAQEQDERVCHDEENHRYSVKTEVLREYMMEHFAVGNLPLDYLEVLKRYGGDIGIGHEDVIFVECFQQGGGVPVIDSLIVVGDKYYLSGHLDGVETELPSAEQLLDGGPILRRFQATVIKDENDAWKLYEFVRNP